MLTHNMNQNFSTKLFARNVINKWTILIISKHTIHKQESKLTSVTVVII